MGYLPVCYSNHALELPELNWQCSVSVDMFNFEDRTPFKVFWQMEPPEIQNIQEKLIRNSKFYDLILTWDEEVLSYCGNARFFPPGSVWNQDPDTSQKRFAVSYLTSSKVMCPGHQFRQDIYDTFERLTDVKNVGPWPFQVSITKHRSPPWLPDKKSLLVPFQYSIIIENARHKNFFTEKLNDCLATKTIPIYWGCPNVGDFYNKDGILSFSGTKDLIETLQWITYAYYDTLKDVVEENYQKAIQYSDRTGNLVRAITDFWTPKIPIVHSGKPNEMPGNLK